MSRWVAAIAIIVGLAFGFAAHAWVDNELITPDRPTIVVVPTGTVD